MCDRERPTKGQYGTFPEIDGALFDLQVAKSIRQHYEVYVEDCRPGGRTLEMALRLEEREPSLRRTDPEALLANAKAGLKRETEHIAELRAKYVSELRQANWGGLTLPSRP